MSDARITFEAPGATPAGHRRLLLFSANFAPSLMVGALRWTRAVEQLSRHGFAFDVVSGEAPEGMGTETQMLASLPPGTRIVLVPTPAPGPWRRIYRGLGTVARARSRVAGATASPEASGAKAAAATTTSAPTDRANPVATVSLPQRALRALHFLAQDEDEERWGRAAVRAAERLLDFSRYAGIVSSGPPHAVHLHADHLAQRRGLPHAVDLRDPWTHWSWVDGSKESPLFLERTRPRQAIVMARAALVTTTTARQTATLREAYPASAARVHTILNGADDTPLPAATDDGIFRIAYTGTLYVDRDPGTLFGAIRAFADAEGLTPDRLRVEFMGAVEMLGRRSVREIAEAAGAAPWLTLTPSRPRAEAMALLARSHVLISFAERLRETIPAKVFEYARFPAWILLVGPRDQATNELLAAGGALSADAHDARAMQEALHTAYRAWRSTGRPVPIAEQLPLARATQNERLAALLARMLDAAPRRA